MNSTQSTPETLTTANWHTWSILMSTNMFERAQSLQSFSRMPLTIDGMIFHINTLENPTDDVLALRAFLSRVHNVDNLRSKENMRVGSFLSSNRGQKTRLSNQQIDMFVRYLASYECFSIFDVYVRGYDDILRCFTEDCQKKGGDHFEFDATTTLFLKLVEEMIGEVEYINAQNVASASSLRNRIGLSLLALIAGSTFALSQCGKGDKEATHPSSVQEEVFPGSSFKRFHKGEGAMEEFLLKLRRDHEDMSNPGQLGIPKHEPDSSKVPKTPNPFWNNLI